MGMQDDLRAELIKQFPAEVMEAVDGEGNLYYACPTCRRAVALNQDKCVSCNQVLSWDKVRKDIARRGVKYGRIEFELPLDFTLGNCRKCPISYISKSNGENVYTCPLGNRNSCTMQVM